MKTFTRFLYQLWRYARWLLLTIIAVCIAWWVYATAKYYPTLGALEEIQARMVTMSDVRGEHLPPTRTEAEYTATLEGLDENGNGIRDDVERAIIATEGDTLQMRAAKLQYAQALQLYFTHVRDGKTLAQVIYKLSAAHECLDRHLPQTSGDFGAFIDASQANVTILEKLEFNTDTRVALWEQKRAIDTVLLNTPDEGCNVVIH